jgi:hypothetical protein
LANKCLNCSHCWEEHAHHGHPTVKCVSVDAIKCSCKGWKEAEDCDHPDFWFSRSLDYCPICDDMEMQTCCIKCGISTCKLGAKNEL